MAILGSFAVVHWDGFPVEEANYTCAATNLCRPKSLAFQEARQGNSPYA